MSASWRGLFAALHLYHVRSKKREYRMDKQTKKQILWGLLIFGGIYMLARRTAAKITVGTAGVRVHKLSLSNIELRVDLPVINESQIPATVTGFLGQILYGATQIGVVELMKPTDIPGFGQITVPFRANISTISAGQAIYSILSNPPVDWSQFRVRGTLQVGPLPIDIDQPLVAA